MITKRMILYWLATLSILFALCTPGRAQDEAWLDVALLNLEEVHVEVSIYSGNSESLSSRLQDILELELRKAGMKIAKANTIAPILQLSLFIMDLEEGLQVRGTAAHIILELHSVVGVHPVMETRYPSAEILLVRTWAGPANLLVGNKEKVLSQTNQFTLDAVNYFLNRWLRINQE